MEVSDRITPELSLTTFCATSKIPMTIFHAFVTSRTAQKVLNTHWKNIQVSSSCRWLCCVTISISS